MLPRLVILAALLVAISCDSATAPDTDDEGLTTGEVTAFVALVVGTGLFPSPPPETNPSPCPSGGTIERALRFSSPEAGTVVREGSVTFTDCAAATGGHRYAVSGTITLNDRFVLNALGGIVQAEGSYGGTLLWALDDRVGSCLFSLAVAVVGPTLVVTGSACGTEVEYAV